MTVDVRLGQLVAAFCFAAVAGTSCATEDGFDLSLPASKYYNEDAKSFLLADNDTAVSKAQNTIVAATPAAEFEPKLITGKKNS